MPTPRTAPVHGILHQYAVTAPDNLSDEQLAEVVRALEEAGKLPHRATTPPGSFGVQLHVGGCSLELGGETFEVLIFGTTVGLIPAKHAAR